MYIDLKVSKDSIENIEKLFTWGEEHRKIILKKFPEFTSKIISTGTPRFDLFDIKFRSIFDKTVEKIKNQFNQFTLICGSFSFVNHFTKHLNYLEVLRIKMLLRIMRMKENFLNIVNIIKKVLIILFI